MPSIYQLKPAFQHQLRPLVSQLVALGVTANQVTLTAMALSLVAGGTLALWHPSTRLVGMIPIVLFLRMALNAIDGMLAREHGMQSALGAILNEFGDVVSDGGLYLPFAYIPGVSAPAVVLVVIFAILSEMAGILGQTIGAQRRYDGPMGKSDRAVTFGTIAALLALGLSPGLWLDLVWFIVSLLLLWTTVNRILGALGEIKPHDPNPTSN